MKLLLLFVAVGVAVGYPTIPEVYGPIPQRILETPMTELRYEELLPVVKETLTTILHRTIPPGCTHVAIPFITVGMVRIHAAQILRDVYRMMESSTVEDLVLLDTLNLPLDTPIDVHLAEVNNTLLKIRERITIVKNIPMPTRGINHVTPAQVELLEIYETIASLLHQYVTELTTILPIAEPIPITKLLATVYTGTIDLKTYWDVPTVKQWIYVVSAEIEKILPIMEPSVCQTIDILPRLVPRIEELVNKIETLSVSGLVQRLSTTTYRDMTVVRSILVKILPIVKETTPIVKLVTTLRTPDYETEFMRFIINFISERFVTTTVMKLNTKTMITEFLRTNEAVVVPSIQKVLAPVPINSVAVEPLMKVLAKMTVLMRMKGLPLIDCVEIIGRTFEIATPSYTGMIDPIHIGSWESREYMETITGEGVGKLIEEIFRKI